jgi:hypothetical protein
MVAVGMGDGDKSDVGRLKIELAKLGYQLLRARRMAENPPRITYPRWPQIKSSPPVPVILLSVRRIERFSVITGPIGIMGIVAIFFPLQILAGDLSSKRDGDTLAYLERNWKFESTPLRRGVRCELDLREGALPTVAIKGTPAGVSVAPDWPVPSLMHRRRVLGDRITYVGLDCHKDGIVVAVAEGGVRGEVRDYGRIANTPAALQRLVRKLGQEGVRLRFC